MKQQICLHRYFICTYETQPEVTSIMDWTPVTGPGWTGCTSPSSLQMVGDKPVLFITSDRSCTERGPPSISQPGRGLCPPPTDPSTLIKLV